MFKSDFGSPIRRRRLVLLSRNYFFGKYIFGKYILSYFWGRFMLKSWQIYDNQIHNLPIFDTHV